ncbi:MAG: response regulator transcription factor [Lachnospiraceae bacterium]|nr:response regulator transcription factor [Lachnospiraceae bacterium]
MKTILIIEDEKNVNELLAKTLSEADFETLSAYTGLEGLEFFRQKKVDLVLLDLMLPYKSGDEVLREIRRENDIPVIVISAKEMVRTKIDLLTLGADDYITKPFDLGEVTARVISCLRRYGGIGHNKQLIYKDMILDLEAKTVMVNGKEIALTATEYQILELFLQYPNKVFSKANLYETLWNEEYLGEENVIKTHISNLRNKLRSVSADTEYIETVWGLGYRLMQ